MPTDSFARTDLLIRLYELGCIQFGNFTMVSGLQSPVYIDLRRIITKPALLKEVSLAYAELIKPLTFDRLAAVPYAALTIGTAVALVTDHPLIYPRKEVKAHGTGRAIEGIFSAGEKVVIIEDLVTQGGSALKAIETLEAAGLVVSDVAVLIDREQGARKRLAAKGYNLHTAFHLSEIIESLHRENRISTEQLAAVRNYLESKLNG